MNTAKFPLTLPLRYQILGFILLLTIPILAWLSVSNYFGMQRALVADNQSLQAQTENNIANALKLVDSGYKMFEKPLNDRLRQACAPLLEAYQAAAGDPSQMDLPGLKQTLEERFQLPLDIYFINRQGVVEFTTYPTDLGLNFQQTFPAYFQKLTAIRLSGQFFADRITAEALTGELRKFVYHPTPDQRFLIELGVTVRDFPEFFEEIDPLKIASKLKEFNPTLERIRLFTRSGMYELGKPEEKLPAAIRERLQALEASGKPAEEIPLPEQQRLIRYIRVDLDGDGNPPRVVHPQNADPQRTFADLLAHQNIASEIVELTYSTELITQTLRRQVYSSLFVGLTTLVMAVVFAIIIAGRLSKPILQLTHAARQMADGQWGENLPVARRDELGVLTQAFNSMSEQLRHSLLQLEAKNAELKRLDQLKDEFLANTSHELRTPLNGIVGIAESLLDGAAGPLTPNIESNLSMIITSGRRLTNLVNDILDFSKLRCKDLNLNIKAVDVGSVIRAVEALVRPTIAHKRDLELRLVLPEDLSLAAADEDRLQQILYNLIGNAIKFTDSGVIEVRAMEQIPFFLPAHTSQQRAGKQIVVRVKDTGIGIPPQKLPRIFESFEQADGSLVREKGGTGLGLAVTKQLVELHGGTIEVESTPNQGTSFTFSLPAAERAAETVQRSMQTVPRLSIPETGEITPPVDSLNGDKTSKILVVDDEPINHQVLVNNLFLQHYTIYQAFSGGEALEVLDSGILPDLIILDIMMPRMTGYDVTRQIRQRWQADEVPILLLTAKNQVSDLVAGLEAGANDFITKPIARDELIARIKVHLQLKQTSDENRRLNLLNQEACQQAESANRAKTAFMANISHELRTPLNAILGYSEMLREEVESAGIEDLAVDLDKIDAAGRNLLGLISDVLDVTKIESEQLTLEHQTFSIEEVLRDVTSIITPLLNGNRLTVHSPPGIGDMTGDAFKIQQILQNLLNNAIKFTHQGVIDLRVEHQSPWVIFSVEDNGIGINEAQLDTIFQLFNQADNSSTRRYGGLGLGLALCQKLTDLMGGRISVESEVGQGSLFVVYLPEQPSRHEDASVARENENSPNEGSPPQIIK